MGRPVRFLFVHAWQGFSLAEWSLREALTAGVRCTPAEFHAVDLWRDPSPLGDLLPRTVAALQPDLVGFTCHAWSLSRMLECARCVKDVEPQARVVLGGPQVSDPRSAEAVLRAAPAVDFVVRGQGEGPLARLVEAIREGRPPDDVPSLSWRDGTRVVHAPVDQDPWRRGPIFHAGNPLALSLEHALQASYETTRGCRGACTYCAYRTTPRGELDLGLVKDELAFLTAMRIQHLRICDAEFGGTRERAKDILRHLSRVNAETSVKVHPVLAHVDGEYVDLLRAAGAVPTSIGVQSTNPGALAAVRRGSALRREEAVERLLRAFPGTPADVIVGLPGDGVTGLARTLREVLDAGFSAVNLYRLVAFPGTTMAEDVSASLGGGPVTHSGQGLILTSASFPRSVLRDVALLTAAAEVAAPLVLTRRAITPRRPGSALLDVAHRIPAADLLVLQGAMSSFRPAQLLARTTLLAAVARDLAGPEAGIEALAQDVAEILLRQAKAEGRRSFTWSDPGGWVREVDQVALPARGGIVLDLAEGRLRPGIATGERVLAMAADLSPVSTEATA